MKSEIESYVGNVTVQDIKLVQWHCTKQKACTATLYKTKSLYSDYVQAKKLVQRLCTRKIAVRTRQYQTRSYFQSKGGDVKIRGLKDWPKANREHTGSDFQAMQDEWEQLAAQRYHHHPRRDRTGTATESTRVAVKPHYQKSTVRNVTACMKGLKIREKVEQKQ